MTLIRVCDMVHLAVVESYGKSLTLDSGLYCAGLVTELMELRFGLMQNSTTIVNLLLEITA